MLSGVEAMYYVYVLENEEVGTYTGYTRDLQVAYDGEHGISS